MILIDFNQVVFSSLIGYFSSNKKIDKDDIYSIVFSELLKCAGKFKKQYSGIVIAFDSKNYWRKDIYPYYKMHRKELRDQSLLDWSFIFTHLNNIKEDLRQHFPYKCIEISGAEADDIIAVIASVYSRAENILIYSSDSDFIQLQKYPNVKQYSPNKSVYITHENPILHLKEKIIRGDRNDYIPSFLSPDDTFVIKKRQTPITKQKLEQWLIESPEVFCSGETLDYFYRNQKLIDFDYIPSELRKTILDEFENVEILGNRRTIYKYLVDNRLVNFLENLGEF